MSDPSTAVFECASELDRHAAPDTIAAIDRLFASEPRKLVVDLRQVESFDSAGIGALVQAMRHGRERGVEVKLRGMSKSMVDFFSLVRVGSLTEPGERRSIDLDPVTRIGAATLPLLEMMADIGRMTAGAARSIFLDPFRGRMLRFDRTVRELDQAANGALPIVLLIAFLLGLILAMQAWVQLRLWGAEIFMADMVGVSVMTEIGPLMTAIVLAARSGSSNAAQLGSMVVGEEIDALRQMGVDPIRFLVAPKVVALGIAVVGLGVVFDLVAMGGGLLFGFGVADIEPYAYVAQTRTALHFADFAVALAKSLVFGLCIGVVGCGLGLRVKGGSEGVGRATTNSVVLSIFLIIIIDAIFVTGQRMLLS
ncbi:MAG: ABC transporter permease [Planctomycetes bacterium]|nr:ABC transporter permease [Planctomycetota bacterium]